MERHDGAFWNVDVPPHVIYTLIHIAEVHLRISLEDNILYAQEMLKEKKFVIGL